MYYEIYADSLLLLQFFMNFYLLAIVNHMLYKAVRLRRVLMGAALGAIISLVPFFLPIRFLYGALTSFLLSTGIMSIYTFRAYKKERFIRVLEKMLIATLLLGGILLFLLRILGSVEGERVGMIGVLAVGALCYVVVQYLTEPRLQEDALCKVFFSKDEGTLEVDALMDTGNTLMEPVSKRPVAVIEEGTFQKLFAGKDPEYYRIIPYQSVGKRHGLLKGYPIDAMQVEIQGIRKECKNIYVAVSEEILSRRDEYKLILNPQILEE